MNDRKRYKDRGLQNLALTSRIGRKKKDEEYQFDVEKRGIEVRSNYM